MRLRLFVVCILILSLVAPSISGQNAPTGTVTGEVRDASTQSPLIGANVMLKGTDMGAATDERGQFKISGVQVGSYTLVARYIGYQTTKIPDVIVKSSRQVLVPVEIRVSPLRSEEVTFTAGYFVKELNDPASVTSFSNEAIRRAPGSAGDVSRILMSLPSIAKVNDQSNRLIVRGGNPMENAFFIDNIEVPNINHFPDMASSGGPIGMVNTDFIEDVSFYSGGFPVAYGDVLSSVMDIDFRKGNTKEFYGQLDFNFGGFGGTFEGPSPVGDGAWMLSARRSYLDFVVQALDVGSTVAPVYGDIQGKVKYDLSPNHRVSIIGLYGDDHNSPDRQTGIENKMIYYGNQDIYQGTTGLNWRALWSEHGYSNTSLAFTSEQFHEDWFETNTGGRMSRNHSLEQMLKLRNSNHLRVHQSLQLNFGLEAKHLCTDYDNYYAGMTGTFGDSLPDVYLQDEIRANKVRVFGEGTVNLTHRFAITAGVSAMCFTYTDKWSGSPRLSMSYIITDRTTLTGSIGLYHQQSPLLLLVQNPDYQSLRPLRAIHYIAGIKHTLAEDTRLTFEVYRKDYSDFPMDQARPCIFVIDTDRFANFSSLVSLGVANSRGMEIILQKKLAKRVYGLASLSYFRSKYRGLDNQWRNRNYDNRLIASLDGGYKPNKYWDFSMRWLYAGGPPYTPIDMEASREVHRAVYQEDHVNEARYPDYHSMNIRADRRFYFRQTNLTVYLSVWNVYDRKNIASYFWNDAEGKIDVIYQWRVLPIIGAEFEF